MASFATKLTGCYVFLVRCIADTTVCLYSYFDSFHHFQLMSNLNRLISGCKMHDKFVKKKVRFWFDLIE